MTTTPGPAEELVTLRNVSWKTYEDLLADFEDQSTTRLAFDRGVLEIMSPSPEHEKLNRAVALLVEVAGEELDFDIENFGSATFKRDDLLRGFEPDSCFYIQNADKVRDKRKIDLETDPPPDLVIEIDITNRSLNKQGIYAHIGVPEIWRYDGMNLEILLLDAGKYLRSDASVAFAGLTSESIASFIHKSKSTKRRPWLKAVREWVRTTRGA